MSVTAINCVIGVDRPAIPLCAQREIDSYETIPGGATFQTLLREAPNERPLDIPDTREALHSGLRIQLEGEPIALHGSSPVNEGEVRESAEQLVASALLMPVLEQMNASPLRPTTGAFALNTAEKRFGPLLHQHMADRIMRSRSFGIVDAIVARMTNQPGNAGRLEVTG